MKKITLTMIACALGLVAQAQTDFRSLSFDEAREVAQQEKKLVFIDFYTDWCGPCKKMSSEVFPAKEVGNFMNEKFVSLKLNAEKEGKELAVRYQVKAYPTYVVIDPQGEVVFEARGYMDATAFMAKVGMGIDPDQSPVQLEKRYKKGERTPELINNYALYLMEQKKEEEGMAVVDDYFRSLTEKQKLADENSFLYTRYALIPQDVKTQFMTTHRNKFEEPVRTAILERIGLIYNAAFIPYYSGYLWREGKFDEKEYKEMKKVLRELGLEKTYNYAPMYRLIECRVSSDDDKFLQACEKEFDVLSANAKDLLMMNLTRLIVTEDPATIQKMVRFIREHLSGLNPHAIMICGRTLDGLESKLNK